MSEHGDEALGLLRGVSGNRPSSYSLRMGS